MRADVAAWWISRMEGQIEKTYRLSDLKSVLAEYCCPEQTDPRVPNVPQTAWLKAVVRIWEEMGWSLKCSGSADHHSLNLE
jgi:hypothetical protein